MLAKSKKFDSAWSLVLERIGEDEKEPTLVSGETFSIMIRRYTRAGNKKIGLACNLKMKFGFTL